MRQADVDAEADAHAEAEAERIIKSAAQYHEVAKTAVARYMAPHIRRIDRLSATLTRISKSLRRPDPQ